MSDFIRWLEREASEPIVIISIFIAAIVFCVALFVSIYMLVIGQWLTPLVVWVVLPSYFVAREYIKSRKKKK